MRDLCERRVPPGVQEGRGHLLGGAQGAERARRQVRGHQVHEEALRFAGAGTRLRGLHAAPCIFTFLLLNYYDYCLLQVNGLREVQALRRMAPHPNIVRLLEVLLCAARSPLACVQAARLPTCPSS